MNVGWSACRSVGARPACSKPGKGLLLHGRACCANQNTSSVSDLPVVAACTTQAAQRSAAQREEEGT